MIRSNQHYHLNNISVGNFIALGHMDSTVEIWDLDVVNTMEPAYVLGIPAVSTCICCIKLPLFLLFPDFV